jgi:phosphatidylethanolamine-binding protein (PEBP) family uncharacterized protein
MSTAIAYELQLLIDRLLTLGAVDPDAYREDEIDWMHWIGADTGEIVVALIVRERTYWEDSRSKDIIVQREAKGRLGVDAPGQGRRGDRAVGLGAAAEPLGGQLSADGDGPYPWEQPCTYTAAEFV